MTKTHALKIFNDRELQESLTDEEYIEYIATLRKHSNVKWDAEDSEEIEDSASLT